MKGWDNCPRCGGSGFAGGLLLCNDEAPAPGRLYVEEKWQSYERLVVPRAASAEQRQDMRDTFFAGAWAVFSTMENEVSNENHVTPEDEQVMVRLSHELEAYREKALAAAHRAREARQKRQGRPNT